MVTVSRRRVDPQRDATRAARKEDLLDAAVRVIRRDGPTPSMDAIAAEAGITKPILYRHFQDRSGLVAALAQRYAAELQKVLSSALAAGDDARTLFVGTVDAYLAFVERDPHLYRFVSASTSVEGFLQQVGREVAVVLGEQLRAAGRDSGGAEPMAHGLVGFVHAAGDWWLDRRTLPRERLLQYLTDLLWEGLAGITEQRSQR
jgi:AcrR family transcriptional regulator